jgi:hypothetical protein
MTRLFLAVLPIVLFGGCGGGDQGTVTQQPVHRVRQQTNIVDTQNAAENDDNDAANTVNSEASPLSSSRTKGPTTNAPPPRPAATPKAPTPARTPERPPKPPPTRDEP